MTLTINVTNCQSPVFMVIQTNRDIDPQQLHEDFGGIDSIQQHGYLLIVQQMRRIMLKHQVKENVTMTINVTNCQSPVFMIVFSIRDIDRQQPYKHSEGIELYPQLCYCL